MKNKYDSSRNRWDNDDNSYERPRRDADFNSDFSRDRSNFTGDQENQRFGRDFRNDGWNDPYIRENYGSNNSGRRPSMNNDSSVDYQNERRNSNSGNMRNRDRYSGNNRDHYDWNNGERYNSNHNIQNDNDRSWWDKTADEVSSWFGDEDAERRRRRDKMEGPHRGKGPKGYTRSDETIKNDVNEALYHETYVDASDIDVRVDNGEVTLSGTVDSRMAKRRAEDCIERITGVTDVSNHLKVQKTTDINGNETYSTNESSTKDTQKNYESYNNGNKNKNVVA
ncbi:MAG: BON domain-containing protein [Ginsengibacter sp.]